MRSPLEEKLEEKLDVIKELRTKLQSNISDEGTAQRTYSDQQRLAHKAGIASVEYVLKDIAIQEANHTEMFRRAIVQLDREETNIKTQIEAERKKKEDEDHRKRAAPLSEGYHGPYRLRR